MSTHMRTAHGYDAFLSHNREGLTQAQLAERMGCTQSRVSKMEHASLSSFRNSR
ncbi:MAG: helix-turn-helix domain-containing protein [Spirochaetota bacterium]